MSTGEAQMRRRLRVKELLAEKGMSMDKLARRGWMTRKTVRNVCRNPFHAAKDVTLEKIAQVLDVPMSELYEFVPFSDTNTAKKRQKHLTIADEGMRLKPPVAFSEKE